MDNHSLRVFYARPIDCKKGTVGTFFMNIRDLNDNADVHKGLATRLARPRSPYSGRIPTAESQQQVYRHNSGNVCLSAYLLYQHLLVMNTLQYDGAVLKSCRPMQKLLPQLV